MIALSVKDNVIPYIANITEPNEYWIVLKNLYASGTNSRKLLLRRRLTNLKMEEGSSMSAFLQLVKELINEFACIGETITVAEIVEHVLMALPETFEGLVNTSMYCANLPTMTEFTVILLHDDIRREIKGSKQGDHEFNIIEEGLLGMLLKTILKFSKREIISSSPCISARINTKRVT